MNRRATAPLQLYLTNFEGLCKEEMSKHNGYENWDIYMRPESYLDIFHKDKLIYLTSESPNVVTELCDEKVYVIGGLVDHNSHKVRRFVIRSVETVCFCVELDLFCGNVIGVDVFVVCCRGRRVEHVIAFIFQMLTDHTVRVLAFQHKSLTKT